jgi:hypothetical protein
VIGAGAVGGAALTAVLAPIGTRLRVPSIVAARAPLGFSGAQLLALLLFVTNFAWIALNNAIAASICVRLTGMGSEAVWAAALGLVATLIVLGGPRVAALVDRVAVPVLLVAGAVFTLAIVRAPAPSWPGGTAPFGDVVRGLDMVAGYQVSWLLMFADYPRFVRSGRAAGLAVFLGLALTALWFMPLGLVASAMAGSAEPGAMVYALQLGWWGATLLALAALTTNFVNIYMSALALKSLRPAMQTPRLCGSSAASVPRWACSRRVCSSDSPDSPCCSEARWCPSAASCWRTTSCCASPCTCRISTTSAGPTRCGVGGPSPVSRPGRPGPRSSTWRAVSVACCPASPSRLPFTRPSHRGQNTGTRELTYTCKSLSIASHAVTAPVSDRTTEATAEARDA